MPYKIKINEHLETLIARPKDFFNKNLHLYRIMKEKVDIVQPTFLNNGTYLSSPRASSFWTPNFEIIKMYNIRWRTNKLYQYLNITDKFVKVGYEFFSNGDLNVIFGLTDRLSDSEKEEIKEKINDYLLCPEQDVYVYEVTVKGSDPDVGIGRNWKVSEITIDRPIKPDKVTKYSCMKDLIHEVKFVTDKDEFMKYREAADKYMLSLLSTTEKFLKQKDHGSGSFDPKVAQKTGFFRDEFINAIDQGKDAIILADSHIGKNIPYRADRNLYDVLNQANSLGGSVKKVFYKNKTRFILLLGDIIDKKWINYFDIIMKTFIKAIDGWTTIIYIFGNSEISLDPEKAIQTSAYNNSSIYYIDYKIETDKYIFSHAPYIGDLNGKINIHAHLHGINKYWGVDEENLGSYIDIWNYAPEGKPILLSEILKKSKNDKPDRKTVEMPSFKEMKHDEKMNSMYKIYKKMGVTENMKNYKIIDNESYQKKNK